MEALKQQNPFRVGLDFDQTPDPCTMIIFGASGDLTKRKLIPALYSLACRNQLPSHYRIVGTARSVLDTESFRNQMRESTERFYSGRFSARVWENFARRLTYQTLDLKNEAHFRDLRRVLADGDQSAGTNANRLFYFSIPPSLYTPVVHSLGATGLQESNGWTRVIIEKPFGHDLASMRELNRAVLDVFREDQVYRIDHYLGKETVQNIMVLRFANGIFEPLWNQRYVDHIQITAAESIGVEQRGGYYEQAGTLRDMIQNHLFQVLSLIAMEPPSSLEPNQVRDEKAKVVRAIRTLQQDEIERSSARGQYGEGAVDGVPVPGYRREQDVDPKSGTETFAALRLMIDNWRWAGVPFYLRSAKRMPKRVTEVAIQFREAPHLLFEKRLRPNAMIIRIQPDEGVSLQFGSKRPGPSFDVRTVNMDFHYGNAFSRRSPDAYERLLLDALIGDSTLFARGDTVELCWELLMPILSHWVEHAPDFPNYSAGTWGPEEADNLVEQDGHRWRHP